MAYQNYLSRTSVVQSGKWSLPFLILLHSKSLQRCLLTAATYLTRQCRQLLTTTAKLFPDQFHTLAFLTSSPQSPVWGEAVPSCSSPSSWSSPGWWQPGSGPCAASASSHMTPRHSFGSENRTLMNQTNNATSVPIYMQTISENNLLKLLIDLLTFHLGAAPLLPDNKPTCEC